MEYIKRLLPHNDKKKKIYKSDSCAFLKLAGGHYIYTKAHDWGEINRIIFPLPQDKKNEDLKGVGANPSSFTPLRADNNNTDDHKEQSSSW